MSTTDTIKRSNFFSTEYSELRKQIESSRGRISKMTIGTLFVVPASEFVVGIGKAVALQRLESSGAAQQMLIYILLVLGLLLPLFIPGVFILFVSEHMRIMRAAFYIRNIIEPQVQEPKIPPYLGNQAFLGPVF